MDNSFVQNSKKLQKKKKRPKGTSFFNNQDHLKELSDDDQEDTTLKNLSESDFSENEGLETESDVDDECTGEETDDRESITYSSDQSDLEDNTFKRMNRRIELKKCDKKKNYKILQEESDFDSE